MPVKPYGSRKVIVTCAVTGGSEFNRKHPAFPVTPEEIANAAIEAAKAGAAIVHVHTRDPETGGGIRTRNCSPRLPTGFGSRPSM